MIRLRIVSVSTLNVPISVQLALESTKVTITAFHTCARIQTHMRKHIQHVLLDAAITIWEWSTFKQTDICPKENEMFGNSIVLNVLGEIVHCCPHIFSGCLQVLIPVHADNLVRIRKNAERVMTTPTTYNCLDQVNETSSWPINGLQPIPLLAHCVTVCSFRSFACGVDCKQRHAAT